MGKKDIKYFQNLEDLYNSLDEDDFLDRAALLQVIRTKLRALNFKNGGSDKLPEGGGMKLVYKNNKGEEK